MIDEILQNEDGDLNDLFQDEITTAATDTKTQQPGPKPSQVKLETYFVYLFI